MTERPTKKFFYGWWIAMAGLGVTFVMAGTGFYSFSVLLKPLMNAFGWNRGTVSVAQSIYLMTAAVVGLFVSRFVTRYGIKRVVLTGAVITGAAWVLLSLTQQLWQLYLLYLFIGLGLGIAGLVPVSIALANWFRRRRGIAMGLATVGIALGAMVLVPLIGYVTQRFGWRSSYLFMGAIVLAVDIPLALFVLKTHPREMGLSPDGDESPEDLAPAENPGKATVLEVRSGSSNVWLKTLPLWLLCVGYSLANMSEMSILIHEVSFITDIGVPAAAAAAALGFTGGMGGIGKIVFGWMSDRMSTRYVTMLCFILQLMGVLILIRVQTMAMVWLFVIVFGFAMGGMVTLMPLAVADIFGTTRFGTIYGFVHFFIVGVSTVGPPFAGFVYDATGSYMIVFVTFAILYLVSLVTIYFAWGTRPQPFLRTGFSAVARDR